MNLITFIFIILFVLGLGDHYDSENDKPKIDFIVQGMISLYRKELHILNNPSAVYNSFSDYVIGTNDISSSNLYKLVKILYSIQEKLLNER